MDVERISQYIFKLGRPVDQAILRYHFENGSAEDVMVELEKFQNDDGGFGNAIEPDLRLPQSTALATWMAFQTIKELDIKPGHKVIQKALAFLSETFERERVGWSIIIPEVDEYPHAPWWDYKSAMEHFSWANPSAEILGLFMKYARAGEHAEIVDLMKPRALEHIKSVDPSDFHDAFNYKALYELSDPEFQSVLKEPVEQLIKSAVTMDPEKWGGYVATPLKFIESTSDVFVHLFDGDVIAKNLDVIENQLVDGTHWEPNWNWSGTYPEVWEQAKIEWSGHLTVKHLRILRNFGRI